MFNSSDGRDKVDDWYFIENQKHRNANQTGLIGGQNDNTANQRTKDFIENELHAMSTLSLYDDSLDKVKMPGDGDK